MQTPPSLEPRFWRWWFFIRSQKDLRINEIVLREAKKKKVWREKEKRNKFIIITHSTTTNTAVDSVSSIPTLLCRSTIDSSLIYTKHYSSGVCVCLCAWQVSGVEIEFSPWYFIINNRSFSRFFPFLSLWLFFSRPPATRLLIDCDNT